MVETAAKNPYPFIKQEALDLKRWPVIRHIRWAFLTWRYLFIIDVEKGPHPMDLEYLAGVREGAW